MSCSKYDSVNVQNVKVVSLSSKAFCALVHKYPQEYLDFSAYDRYEFITQMIINGIDRWEYARMFYLDKSSTLYFESYPDSKIPYKRIK